MRRWRRVVVMGLAMLAAGCQDAGLEALEQRLVAWRDDAVAPPMRALSAPPMSVPVSYRFADTPDPFSFVDSRTGRVDGPEMSTRHAARVPLEGHALDALVLVGTLRVAGEAWALVETPEGRVHRVGSGDRLGRHRGRIVTIADAAVHLVERRPDGNGGWDERDVTLMLDD